MSDEKHKFKTNGVMLRHETKVIEIEFKEPLTLEQFEQFLRDLEILDEDQIQEGIRQWKEN